MSYSHPTAFSAWDDEERAAIERVIASGRFTQGEEVAAFEAEFASWHGRAHGIMTNSGSSANLLMIAALSHLGAFKPGDRALVPALAWSTTYAPLVQHGLDLVLVDCDQTWNADPEAFRHDPGGIKLVVGCSILGNAADLHRWASIAGVLGAVFIEDNCESLGASLNGRRLCGTFGAMSSFSFFYSHQISAIEGGMVLTDSAEIAKVLRMLRAHGWTRDVQKPADLASEYDFRLFGYNVRGLELHAAIAREQLKKLPGFIKRRRKNLEHFRRAVMRSRLVDHALDLQWTHPACSPFGLQFCLANPDERQPLADALRAAGIDCRLPTGGSFTQHAYGERWRGQPTPNADRIHRGGMFLGNGPVDLTEHIDRAVAIMTEVLT